MSSRQKPTTVFSEMTFPTGYNLIAREYVYSILVMKFSDIFTIIRIFNSYLKTFYEPLIFIGLQNNIFTIHNIILKY